MWLPLLVAGLVAAVALVATLGGALGGGLLSGREDTASSATDLVPSAAVVLPTSAAPATAVVVAAPTPTATPAPTPTSTSAAAPPAPRTPAAGAPAGARTVSEVPVPPSPAPAHSAASSSPAPKPAPAPKASPAPEAAGPEGQVLALVNVERAAAGCDPLSADAALAAVARAHSADMRDRDYFSHTDPDGLDPFQRAAAAGVDDAMAENIAQGQPDARAVMADWMASPGHRQNILDCALSRLGVGVAEGAGGPWWTQLFG
jgi:uncharacterized protein YkwD